MIKEFKNPKGSKKQSSRDSRAQRFKSSKDSKVHYSNGQWANTHEHIIYGEKFFINFSPFYFVSSKKSATFALAKRKGAV